MSGNARRRADPHVTNAPGGGPDPSAARVPHRDHAPSGGGALPVRRAGAHPRGRDCRRGTAPSLPVFPSRLKSVAMVQGCDASGFASVLSALRRAAPGEDEGLSIRPSVDLLLDAVPLDGAAPDRLVAIAEANLSVARLAEGHANASQLLRLHGRAAGTGRLLGVWGADGQAPVVARGQRLAGTKRYASGLGIVERALVTVACDDGIRLALVDVSDPARHRPGAWQMAGMRATVSGEVDLDGLDPDWVGAPGDYHAEPHFVGGVWRIAALQLGGTFGLLGAARDWLADRGRLDADAQVARLAPLIARALAARGLVERAADVASGPEGLDDPDRAVMLSSQARLLTEDLAQDAIAAVERAIGLPHFEAGSETGRIARDLATYCRQAARDAFEQRAGRIALNRPGPISALWHG